MLVSLLFFVAGIALGWLVFLGCVTLMERVKSVALQLALFFLGCAAGFGTFVATPSAGSALMARSDEAFFRQTKCDHPKEPERLEIGPDGFPAGLACVMTTGGAYNFISRTEYAVRICLGRAGDCATGHGGPAVLTQGVTILPMESKTLRFPRHWFWTKPNPRNYPITLQSGSGSQLRHSDLVVRSENSSSGSS